jgi:hypothetical protein
MEKNERFMVEWHRPDLNPEDIAKIIREGREENDKKFDSYLEYVGYISKDNDRILNALGSDYDEDGIPYWKKWEDYNAKQIEGRDNV